MPLLHPRALRQLRMLLPLLVLVAATAGAQPAARVFPQPAGPPFFVNRPQLSDIPLVFATANPAVAMDARGNVVVVWWDGTTIEGDAEILAQRYDAASRQIGDPFLVSTERPPFFDADTVPDVAMAPDGRFVVVWNGFGPDETTAILMQRFAADGAFVGENRIVASGDSFFDAPQVAMAESGAFAVTWLQTPFESASSLFVQRFDAAGAAIATGSGRIDATFPTDPSIGMDRAGNFVVAWDDSSRILATRFNVAAGSYQPVAGGEPLDAADSDSDRREPAVAVAPDGAFAVAWNDFSSDRVVARRFTADGLFTGQPIIFDAEEASNEPIRAAFVGDAILAVVWGDEESDSFFIRLGLVAPGSTRPDRASVVNSGGFTDLADLAGSPGGELFVAFASSTDLATDPLVRSQDIYGRRYTSPAVDAVESDATTAVSEGGASDTIALALRTIPNAPVTVTLTPDLPQIALNNAAPGAPVQLRFAPDRSALTPQLVAVRAVADDAAEGPHNATIRLSASGPESGYDSPPPPITVDGALSDTIVVAITDDRLDQATYTVSGSVAATNEGNATPVTFTVRRDGALGGANGVSYRFAGTASFGADYTVQSGPPGVIGPTGVIPFAAGQAVQEVTIAIVDDKISESNSSIILELLTPQPEGTGRVIFPLAVLTLGDNDLAEVQILQTGGSSRVVRGGAGDTLTVALRSIPISPVQVRLKPANVQLELNDAGWGAELVLTFAADASALKPQTVRIATAGGHEEDATLAAEQSGILLAASSADEGYATGARFTVDGRDARLITVLIEDSGNGTPRIMSLFLPLVRR